MTGLPGYIRFPLQTDILKQLKLPRYPAIGATLIGRLARDESFRGQGIGELLLVDALKVALRMSRKIASAEVVVDAKDDRARSFYGGFGFVRFSEKRLLLRMEAVENNCPDLVSMVETRSLCGPIYQGCSMLRGRAELSNVRHRGVVSR